jgi:hypothetical protein
MYTRTIQEVREIGKKNLEAAIKARKERGKKAVKKENNGWKRQLKRVIFGSEK